MNTMNQIVIWLAGISTVLAAAGALVTAWAISTHRDRAYRAKYEDFEQQKERVQDRLRRHNGN